MGLMWSPSLTCARFVFFLPLLLTGSFALGGCDDSGGGNETANGGTAPSATGSSTDTGSDGTTDGTGGCEGPTEHPASESLVDIEAFLATQTHRAWTGDAAVRAGVSSVNPHGDALRVFFNALALESIAAGPDSTMQGSMVVKEIYGDSGDLEGHALRWKTGEGDTMNDWTVYCSGPDGSLRCSNEVISLPITGAGMATECGFCHGSKTFFAKPPL